MVKLLNQELPHFMDQKVYVWWNGLPYVTRKSFEGDLVRLGMDVPRDQYYISQLMNMETFWNQLVGRLQGCIKKDTGVGNRHGKKQDSQMV